MRVLLIGTLQKFNLAELVREILNYFQVLGYFRVLGFIVVANLLYNEL